MRVHNVQSYQKLKKFFHFNKNLGGRGNNAQQFAKYGPGRALHAGLFHCLGSVFSTLKSKHNIIYFWRFLHLCPLPQSRLWREPRASITKLHSKSLIPTFKSIWKALQILINAMDSLQDKYTHRDRLSHPFSLSVPNPTPNSFHESI